VFRVKWPSFTAQFVINQQQRNFEEDLMYLGVVAKYDSRYIRENKSRKFVKKQHSKKKEQKFSENISEGSVMCYIWNIFCMVLKVKHFVE
jgi:predicted Zn-dependent peptidase